jgi:hypothetical protein
LAGEGVGKEEGLTMARFVLTDGVGRLSAAACGSGRRYLPLEVLLRCDGRREQGIHDTGRRCRLGEVARLLRKRLACSERLEKWAPRWADRQDHRHELRPARCWPMHDLYRQGAATGRPASMPWYSDHLDLRAHETGDGPLGSRRRYSAARAHVPRRQARRGTGCSCLEAMEPGPHGRGGGTRSARRRDGRQIAGALAAL